MESNTNTKRSTVDVEVENNGTCCAAAHKVPNTKSISQKITTPTALDAKAVITQLTIHLLAARSRFSKALPNRVAIGQVPSIIMIVTRTSMPITVGPNWGGGPSVMWTKR